MFQNLLPPSFFPPYCRLVFIGEYGLATIAIVLQLSLFFFFIYFEFILNTNNTNIDSIRKISDCKINALKVEGVQNTFENLKRCKYIKNAFFLFSLFFVFFSKNLSKTWVKN